METGIVNEKFTFSKIVISGLKKISYNLVVPALIKEAVVRGEGHLGLGEYSS